MNENLLNDIKDKFRDQSLIEKVGKYIDKLLKNPNDDFARLIARQFESGFITTGVKERYKEAIVQSQKEKSTIVDPKVNAISQTSTTGDETLATKDIPKPSTNTDKKYNKKQHYIVLSNGVKIGPDKGSVIYGNFFRYLYTTFPEQLKKYVIQGVPSGSKEQQIGTKHPWGPDFGPHTGRGMNSFIDDNMYVNVSRSNNSALASIKFFAEEFGLSVVETNLKSAVKDENGHLKNSD